MEAPSIAVSVTYMSSFMQLHTSSAFVFQRHRATAYTVPEIGDIIIPRAHSSPSMFPFTSSTSYESTVPSAATIAIEIHKRINTFIFLLSKSCFILFKRAPKMKYGLLIFLITLASSQRAIQFEDGDTHEGSLEANGIAHYYWDLKAPCTGNTCEAAFFLTTYSDWTQPHIYVNHDTAGYPTPEAFGWKSDVWGQWGVLLRKDDLEVGQYKLTVMCDKKCEYALSLSYARPITLIDGEPQTATFDAGWMVLYDFTPKVRGKFDVVVTPKIGAVSLHGTPPGSQDQLDVVDTWHNGRSIRQNNRDPDGVYNLSVSARNDTSYTIVADTKSTPIRLLASEPYHHYVSKEKWTHFRLNVDDPDTNVGIRLTTYTGEADIYVKAGEKPTLQDHDFVSRALGNETFTISGVQREWAGHSIGEYFIGILGIRNSAFILAATVNENSIIPMISGIPMQGYVDHGDTDHYALDIPFEHNLNITVQLTSLAHDADLYGKQCFDSKYSSG